MTEIRKLMRESRLRVRRFMGERRITTAREHDRMRRGTLRRLRKFVERQEATE